MHESRNTMMVRADAKAIGMVTALSTTNRRKPRTYTRASECISYHNADKSDATIFRAARAERAPRLKAIPDTPHRTMAYDLPALFAD